MSVLKGEGKVPILFGTRSVVASAITHEVYLARPDLAGEWPTVLILSSAWGVTSSVRDLARRLARQGLAAVVVDPYRGEPPHRSASRDNAEATFRATSPERVLRDAGDVARYMRNPASFWSSAEDGFVVMGSGAAGPLAAAAAAAAGAALILVASAPDPEHLGGVTGPILGLAGKVDEVVSGDDIASSRSAAPHSEWVLYEDIGHDFLDDHLEGFNQEVFIDAVERITGFIEKHLPAPR